MDPKHIEQLKEMLIMYGSSRVMQHFSEITTEEAEKYTEGAIIKELLPIVQKAAQDMGDLTMERYAHVLNINNVNG
jgi:hypothetical protein